MIAIVTNDSVYLRNDLTVEQAKTQYNDILEIKEVDKYFYSPVYDGKNIVENAIIDDVKTSRKNEVRRIANAMLVETDWKCIRHRDQVDSLSGTSLTSEQYEALLDGRQKIRDWSNAQEALIDALTTIEEVVKYTIEEYTNG